MRKALLILAVLMLLVFMLSFGGCSATNSISDIKNNPMQYEGKQVSVKGTVGDTLWFAILSKGAYQIGDVSGTIWVVTTQPPPQKGMEIVIKGSVSTAVKLGDTALGTVITETKRN
jgi:hypothetical protein